jgi:aspartyl-tRNA(Asn)/glutamyl-tRNA(Gln) amidotransferase subunit C
MTLLNKQQVQKIQKLAQLSIKEEELELYRSQLESIFSWVAQLKEVDVSGVEPMISVHEHTAPLRHDVVSHQDLSIELMKVAPKSKYNYYVVPKVVE